MAHPRRRPSLASSPALEPDLDYSSPNPSPTRACGRVVDVAEPACSVPSSGPVSKVLLENIKRLVSLQTNSYIN